MMHLPDRTAMACHTTQASPRWWLWIDRSATAPTKDPATDCRAFASREMRERINGSACEGCARVPEDQR